MTKKDYIILTESIADYHGMIPEEKRVHIETFVTLHLMPKLKADNQNFNEERFLKASFEQPF